MNFMIALFAAIYRIHPTDTLLLNFLNAPIFVVEIVVQNYSTEAIRDIPVGYRLKELTKQFLSWLKVSIVRPTDFA